MERFDSEFASVRYNEEDNIVFLTWKKEAHLEAYRKPTEYALDLLRNHPHSQFIVDARNGFEDVQEDVKWGFNYLLPQMAHTDCQCVCFIMNEINAIEEEMDMWTLEFSKYFAVTRATDYKRAVQSIQESFLQNKLSNQRDH